MSVCLTVSAKDQPAMQLFNLRDNGQGDKEEHKQKKMSFKSKGLANPIGANHCWLNSTIQLLWHIDAFRQAVSRINGHYEYVFKY